MIKIYHFFLQTERMLPIFLEDAEYQSKRLLIDGLKFFWQILKIQQVVFL